MIVTIGKIEWEARFVEHTSVELNSDEPLNGICAPSTHQIFISKGFDRWQTRDTVIHEVTHAYIEQYLLKKNVFTVEELCNFMERYADDIIEKANEIIKGETK